MSSDPHAQQWSSSQSGAASPAMLTVRAPQKVAARALVPARPRAYYKWTDGAGILHVSSSPPPEGVVYSMIRALD